MARVVFFEKPGCINNTRQKAWLTASGHQVEARNLLTHAWTVATLRAFFGDLPVSQWFNVSAPRVTKGEINPHEMDEHGAITQMLTDPLLIRRPLMEVEGARCAGFEPEKVRAWIGLSAGEKDVETCPRNDRACAEGE